MILDELAAYARQRVAHAKEQVPLEDIRTKALALEPRRHALHYTLRDPDLTLICELKKASPSKGIISERFPYRSILHEYQKAGADAISCLTEPKWFMGSDEIFEDVRCNTALPMIRKDFTVDEYQLYEARLLNADAVLLICSLLDTATIAHYLEICDELGLDALVETHNKEEIDSALEAGARIVGVNNRNLKDFTVDITNAQNLRQYIPPEVLYVAESGVKTPADIAAISAAGADGVLMGEVLMGSNNIPAFMEERRRAVFMPEEYLEQA